MTWQTDDKKVYYNYTIFVYNLEFVEIFEISMAA